MFFGLFGDKIKTANSREQASEVATANPVTDGALPEAHDLTQGAKPSKVVVTFHTTSDAMAFESYARQASLPGRLTTIPRQITAGCGYAWTAMIDEANCPDPIAALGEALSSGGLQYEGLYRL